MRKQNYALAPALQAVQALHMQVLQLRALFLDYSHPLNPAQCGM